MWVDLSDHYGDCSLDAFLELNKFLSLDLQQLCQAVCRNKGDGPVTHEPLDAEEEYRKLHPFLISLDDGISASSAIIVKEGRCAFRCNERFTQKFAKSAEFTDQLTMNGMLPLLAWAL